MHNFLEIILWLSTGISIANLMYYWFNLRPKSLALLHDAQIHLDNAQKLNNELIKFTGEAMRKLAQTHNP